MLNITESLNKYLQVTELTTKGIVPCDVLAATNYSWQIFRI